MKTPAHLVPPAAMAGEHTYGFFPSARDIRVAERRKEVKREKASINKIWNMYPTITPRLSSVDSTAKSYDSSSYSSHHCRHTITTPRHSLSESQMTGVETPEKYDLVNLGAYFRHTDDRKQRHFFISPEWISEGVTVQRMDKKKQNNPLNYGWI